MPTSKNAPKKDEDIVGLTKGSRYRVTSKGSGETPLVTIGVFKGYTSFGHDSALSIQLDPEKEGAPVTYRLIPCLTVLAVDVLAFKPEERADEREEVKIYFG